MKVLSLLQPWASLVIMGHKTVETRSWNTHYRGKLLIHASLGKIGAVIAQETLFRKYINDFKTLPFGSIIGCVNLTAVLPISDLHLEDHILNKLTLEEKAFGDYAEGRYAWLFEDPIQFDLPIPARGMISLWDYLDASLNEEFK